MGLIDIDDIASFAIGKAEDKLQGKEKEEKTTFGGCLLRSVVSTIWFIVAFVASLFGVLAMMGGETMSFLGGENGMAICALGIGACLLVFIITMLVPYLRKKGTFTRWCGIVCLGDALWWIYILISGLS